MTFEDSILRKIDRERHQRQRESVRTPTFDRAHARAQAVLKDPKFSIQAPSFIDLYGEENVINDMKRVMKKRNSFAKVNSPEQEESKRVAEVFEAIILEKSQGDGWLGDGVSALKTSLYDDYFNGSDMLAEWEISEGDSQVLALSVDVTFSTLKMSEKIEHIRENVKNGKLGSVKYFKNKDGSFRGERNGIPQVVVGVDRNTVFKLADFWIKGDTSGLASHPVQRVLIDEIAHQLELIKDFAGSRGQKQVADAYSRSLSLIRKIQKQKENIAHGEFGNDRVYKAILEQSKKAFASTDGEKSTG